MRKWSARSQACYDQLDPRLQKVLDVILRDVADISLITGHRNQHDQNELFYGEPQRTKVRWPNSKHNKQPSLAVDFQPYPMPNRVEKLWASLAYVAGYAKGIAKADGVNLRWGGDWDGDGDLTDQDFDDLYHLEIKDV